MGHDWPISSAGTFCANTGSVPAACGLDALRVTIPIQSAGAGVEGEDHMLQTRATSHRKQPGPLPDKAPRPCVINWFRLPKVVRNVAERVIATRVPHSPKSQYQGSRVVWDKHSWLNTVAEDEVGGLWPPEAPQVMGQPDLGIYHSLPSVPG